MSHAVFKSIAITILTLISPEFFAQDICRPCKPFAQHENAIVKSRYFYANLDQRDQRVPRVFVQTHEHIPSLAQWTDEHWIEFGRFAKALELSLKKSFGAQIGQYRMFDESCWQRRNPYPLAFYTTFINTDRYRKYQQQRNAYI